MTMADDRDAELASLRASAADLRARLATAEQALEASRALHAATIESLPFDFWARDRDGYCFSQNATTVANWGDLLHKRPEDMEVPPEVVELWLSNNRRALLGEIVHGDHDYALGGESRTVHNILGPIRMGDTIVGTLGVNVDVTEHHRTLRALRESEEKLQLAAEASGVGFWSWDRRTNAVTWGPALCALFGLAPEDAPRTHPEHLARMHPEDGDRLAARIEQGVAGWEDEHPIRHNDGSVRWILAKGRRLVDRDRDLVVGAVIDVTERHLRDERLRQAQKLEAIGQLTAGIAHNFNNMLMGVLPSIELAAREASPQILPLLEIAERSAQRAAKLVRELLVYAGRHGGSARTVEALAPVVERTATLCRTTFDRRITLDVRCEPTASARVDAVQIEQVLLNLLLNARDAVVSGEVVLPCIEIDLDLVPPHVRIRVRDNGVGMAPATMARIYEPFFTTKSGRGTGLGLATAQAIVLEHGGTLACTSTPGGGTTFSLHLVAESMPDPEVTGDEAPATDLGGTETVLVVDDEDQIREVVGQILDNAGYTPLLAASGAEALVLLADRTVATEVAVVLLDVSLPGRPRAEVRRQILELAPQARLIAFTGYSAEDLDDADPIVQKPASTARLLGAIRASLRDGAAE